MLPLKEMTVTEDEDAEFMCELSKPDSLVKWFKNGVELSANERVSFETVGTKRMLKIHKSVLDDAASYQCQIVSSGASSQAQLTVTGTTPKYSQLSSIHPFIYMHQAARLIDTEKNMQTHIEKTERRQLTTAQLIKSYKEH